MASDSASDSSPSPSPPCYPVRQAVSNGVLQGDNPIDFALPLLVIQIAAVLLVTRSVAFLFKPLRQPRVLAEIIGGVLLGPSGLGRNKAYLNALFPETSLTLLETIANLGLLFFLFMVGLELDLREIKKSGRIAATIAAAGIALPFAGGVGVASILRRSLSTGARFGPLVVFMGVPISITAFPVLVRIMAERKLLASDIAKFVVPAAAINDVCAWILLAIGVAISGPSSSPATPAYVLLWGLGFVLFMLFVVRRLVESLARRATISVTGPHETVSEIYVCIALVGVLVSGFATDAIGIHPLFGAFVFGLIIPAHEGRFAQLLVEKIEDFVTALMLPLFFASSGLKTDLGSIGSAGALGFLALLVLAAGLGKISATAAVALSLKWPLREALTLGFLMNTKGLVELIVLNIGKDLGVFDDQTFAILVLMCLILMFFTTPAVMALYKPARKPAPYKTRKLEGIDKKGELRILACIHGGTTRNTPALLNLVEACKGSTSSSSSSSSSAARLSKPSIKLFAMHLIELSLDRPSSILSLSRSVTAEEEEIASAMELDDNALIPFKTYGQMSKVPVRLLRALSHVSEMHHDICESAIDKRATIILLPYGFHEKEDGSIDHTNAATGIKAMNERVMENAPCSVGLLLDKGRWGSAQLSAPESSCKVGVVFRGGADDREALAFGCRLAEHASVEVFALRFFRKPNEGASHVIDIIGSSGDSDPQDDGDDDDSDEQAVADLKEKSASKENIVFEECSYAASETYPEDVVSATKTRDFSLIVVGHSQHRHSEKSVLGGVGEALAKTSNVDTKASILVIQQHHKKRAAADAPSQG